jgi:VanZ family protein
MNARSLGSWLPVFLYASAIFYFSSLPAVCLPPLFPHADKLWHTLEYGPFGFLLVGVFLRTWGQLSLKACLGLLFVIVLYALSDEIHQLFVPGRVFSYGDIIFDGLGSICGGMIFLWRR